MWKLLSSGREKVNTLDALYRSYRNVPVLQ